MSDDHIALISVGSNIQPEKHLEDARRILSAEQHLIDEAQALKTAPEGYLDQPDFLNGAYLVGCDMSLEEFKQYLKGIETRLHRIRGPIKAGPRNIDLDLIIWDGKIIHSDYPTKSYVRVPIDELLDRHKLLVG